MPVAAVDPVQDPVQAPAARLLKYFSCDPGGDPIANPAKTVRSSKILLRDRLNVRWFNSSHSRRVISQPSVSVGEIEIIDRARARDDYPYG